jgi:hypothetical protein
MTILAKHCSKCGEYRPLTDYYERADVLDGRVSACRECMKVDKRKHYADHQQECIERSRNYYDTHRDQATLNARLRYARKKQQGLTK